VDQTTDPHYSGRSPDSSVDIATRLRAGQVAF
jgi:hypothetical protein